MEKLRKLKKLIGKLKKSIGKLKEQALMVTTEHRGVFFGYGEFPNDGEKNITLTNVRMCIYWPAENHGINSLASLGPLKGARISPSSEGDVRLHDITGVWVVSDKAAKKWEAEPWE